MNKIIKKFISVFIYLLKIIRTIIPIILVSCIIIYNYLPVKAEENPIYQYQEYILDDGIKKPIYVVEQFATELATNITAGDFTYYGTINTGSTSYDIGTNSTITTSGSSITFPKVTYTIILPNDGYPKGDIFQGASLSFRDLCYTEHYISSIESGSLYLMDAMGNSLTNVTLNNYTTNFYSNNNTIKNTKYVSGVGKNSYNGYTGETLSSNAKYIVFELYNVTIKGMTSTGSSMDLSLYTSHFRVGSFNTWLEANPNPPSPPTGGDSGDNTGGNTGDNTGGNTGDNTGGNTGENNDDNNQTNDKEDENHKETVGFLDGILNTITNLPNLIAEGLSSLFQGVVDAVNNVVTGLLDGIKSLFIPNDEFFSNYFNNLITMFESKLGILALPLTFTLRFLDAISLLDNINGSNSISWNDIKDPFYDTTIIKAGSLNFEEIFSTGSIGTLHALYLSFINIYLFLKFLNFAKNKLNDFFGKGGN